ncbi:aromatic-ring-hydroxylating dioxygenase subunit beta [Amycolatopsis rhabdoformis]|uniref:Aromatic-ring-hydroxylating dioxygenase subunit beta n=1 Tax=Amycolatopsis rhabdoformis TaxID=1448059 RepID=A0ABZ1HWC2_9PSEU|nr:aromatic-ring-hydroxylating dioxygenase subunit beta [Amycolatopsis rhabdoformis]WSE26315.1 aromatic-ring-hydroxylating dioxygenase subunit beta [Amycolatopsis rhabdoformis]
MTSTTAALMSTVDEIYRREIRVLQKSAYLDWLAFFAPEFRYRMPVVKNTDARADMIARDGELAYYDEDRTTMELRVRKLASSHAWTEIPPSRLRYFVQVLDLTVGEGGFEVVSNILVFRTRNEDQEHTYYGERTDRFVEVAGEWKIAERVVVLDRARLAAENMNIFL